MILITISTMEKIKGRGYRETGLRTGAVFHGILQGMTLSGDDLWACGQKEKKE